MNFDTNFIAQTILSSFIQGQIPKNLNFCVDSRQVQSGDIFIAIKGSQSDGHDFVFQALQTGASGIVIAHEHKEKILKQFELQLKNKFILSVDEPESAIIKLAAAWRQKFNIPVIGITGTVGKTTTKEMVKTILEHAQIPSLVSYGNQNTLIGVSMNILKMSDVHRVAVLEMGIGETGKMQELAALVRPTFALITVIGHGHLKGLGKQVAVEKLKIFSLFGSSNIGIINGDQPELTAIKYHHLIIHFGKKKTNQIRVLKISIQNNSIHCTVQIYNKKYSVILQSTNQSRVYNALAAIAVGKSLGIADDIMIQAVEQFSGAYRRFERIVLNHECELIDDAYNANPESMKASLAAFQSYQTSRKRVLVLGDMLELADQAVVHHRNVGRMIAKMSDIHAVILIGQHVLDMTKTLPKHIQYYHFKQAQDAGDLLKSMLLDQNTVFLFKASCSMGLVSLVKQLQAV